MGSPELVSKEEQKPLKIAINGFGRIGRIMTRLIWDNPRFELVAINSRSRRVNRVSRCPRNGGRIFIGIQIIVGNTVTLIFVVVVVVVVVGVVLAAIIRVKLYY